MIKLTEEQTPILEGKLFINDLCFAVGVVEQGVIVQYMDTPNSNAVLIYWSDIIALGMNDADAYEQTPLDKMRKEIPTPTPRSETVKVKKRGS